MTCAMNNTKGGEHMNPLQMICDLLCRAMGACCPPM